MAYLFHMVQKIGDEIVSESDFAITKWVNLDGVEGVTFNQSGNIRDPLHSENQYDLARFSCTDTVMNAVLASSPDIIEIGGAGASTVTTPKITTLTEKITGWMFEITQYPVSGSTTNATIQITLKWGENSATGNFPDTRTYNPQGTTFKLAACSRHRTSSGTEKNYLGFLLCPVGGDWASSSTTNRCFCAEESIYGKQSDPLPQETTKGGGGFGTYNNATDVTVNIGVKPSGFLSGVLGGSGFNFYYVPSYHDLIKAAYYSLNGVTNLSDFVNNTAALILNPSTYIVSACCIPVDKSAFGAGAMQNTIRLGGLLNFNVNCYPLGQLWADSPVWFQDLSQMYYDSFMDYEPYTKMHLFLPYIGMVPLNASQCMGGGVTVQYRFEGITGKCIAFVKTTDKNGRNTGFYQYAGDAGYSLPWVGNNGGGSQMIHSAASAAIGLAVGKADVPTVSGLLQTAEKFYSQESRPQMQGGFGVNTGALGGDDIVLFIQRAQNAMPDKYYDVHGYQTATGGKIGDYSGFTRFDFVEISTDATPEENAEIETALKGGVYL